jgi:RNA polymerase sigma-70 factor, ECF subfamily
MTRPAPPDDHFIEGQIMQMAQRDPALFAPLYERYFQRVYAYCLRRSGNAQEAEDLCSQVFTRALAGLHTYRGGLVAAWLFQIAHNVVANHYRGRRQSVALDDFDFADESASGLFDDLDDADDRRVLEELVAQLPEAERDLLALTLDAGLTSEEVGAIRGKSAGAVRVELHRVIKKLRERYHHLTGERFR